MFEEKFRMHRMFIMSPSKAIPVCRDALKGLWAKVVSSIYDTMPIGKYDCGKPVRATYERVPFSIVRNWKQSILPKGIFRLLIRDVSVRGLKGVADRLRPLSLVIL